MKMRAKMEDQESGAGKRREVLAHRGDRDLAHTYHGWSLISKRWNRGQRIIFDRGC